MSSIGENATLHAWWSWGAAVAVGNRRRNFSEGFEPVAGQWPQGKVGGASGLCPPLCPPWPSSALFFERRRREILSFFLVFTAQRVAHPAPAGTWWVQALFIPLRTSRKRHIELGNIPRPAARCSSAADCMAAHFSRPCRGKVAHDHIYGCLCRLC